MTQAALVAPASDILNRTRALFKAQQESVYQRTDRVFAGLMLFQWVCGVIAALCVSPLAWQGTTYSVHLHVWAALILGGAITFFPVCLGHDETRRVYTRHVIAVGQMLMSALLIHLSGGRIETHFHVFGSLAILAFYRDWRVLMTASLVVATDHALRGIFWPQSVYGILTIEPWRWVEHAGWVTFIDIFLLISIRQSLESAWEIAHRQAELEEINRTVEQKVVERTAELETEIAERKQAEADLAETNIKLKALSKDLLQSRDQAVQASRFKSEFLANMSHEIRTPLNAVVGMSDLLMRTRLNDEQREFGSIINSSADVLLGIINDILDYSKIESGRLDLEIIDFDIVDLVEGAAELVAERARSKQLSLSAFIEPGIPSMVRGDSGRIRQVLLNFLSNAIKFTDRGEIVISAVLVEGTASDGAVKVRFSVKDTGIGLSDSAREKLFQPFTQADSSVTRRYGGTGLGLAISKRLVELMDGNIEFDSVYGEGAEFSFTVELQACAPQLPVDAALPATRILLVDGPQGTQQILSSYICAWGLRCSTTTDVDKAVTMLRREAASNDPYQLVIVAFEPNNLEPLSLLREVRPFAQLATTKMVAIGSSADREFGQQALKDGFSAFLQLPLRQSTLRECILNLTVDRESPDDELTPEIEDLGPAARALPEPEPRNLVLVVEDNPANQKVAMLQLRELGLAAHAVGNGMEALEAVARTQYALILMDCQMPEMDGFQATAEIRKMEALTGTYSPIIAMTALAMSSDRMQCLAAGMDDYISKPVSQKKLADLIARWLPKFHCAQEGKERAAPVVDGMRRPIELDVLQATFGPVVAQELLRDFDVDVRRLLKQIAEGIQQRDVAAIKHSAHELKGESASLYATEMSELSRALENLVAPADINWTAVEAGLNTLRQAFARVKAQVEESLNET